MSGNKSNPALDPGGGGGGGGGGIGVYIWELQKHFNRRSFSARGRYGYNGQGQQGQQGCRVAGCRLQVAEN